MAAVLESIEVGLAAEVFVATALLHREQPGRSEFTIQEIVNRAAQENIAGRIRSGLNVHASLHCVANRAPNPAKHRMLFATGKHTRRLLLPEDEVHPGRTGKIFPETDDLPEEYWPLLQWAKTRYQEAMPGARAGASAGETGTSKEQQRASGTPQRWLESLFELEGLGQEYWKGVDPDEFVRKLREGWE
ncbi:MAG: hypothetical protein ACLQG3_13475 [Terracidiphilus sp.]